MQFLGPFLKKSLIALFLTAISLLVPSFPGGPAGGPPAGCLGLGLGFPFPVAMNKYTCDAGFYSSESSVIYNFIFWYLFISLIIFLYKKIKDLFRP
jgi:hypothetical protein